MKIAAIALLVSAMMLLGVCIGQKETDINATEKDIVDIAVENNLTNLVTALSAVELVDTLKAPGPFTVFAPTDQAFVNLTMAANVTLDVVLADKENLTKVLKNHVVDGKIISQNLTSGTLMTLQGQNLTINATEMTVNNAKIIKADINASNGVIHIIDAVLTL